MAEFVKLTGLTETLEKLKSIPRLVKIKGVGPLRGATHAAARAIANVAQMNAPVDTGNMRAQVYVFRDTQAGDHTERYSVSVRTGRKKGKRLALLKIGRRDAYYWFMVEFGTSKMHAQPFMRPAFEGTKEAAVKLFEAQFRAGVDKIAARLARSR